MCAPTDAVRVWIDDGHAVLRRGMAAALASAGMVVVGESARFDPPPDVADLDVLVFEAEGTGLRSAVAARAGRPLRLVATVHDPWPARIQELAGAGVAAVLTRQDLTPDQLARTVASVAEGTAPPPALALAPGDRGAAAPASGPGALSDREREVLRMLAQGEDTRGIALALCYSERTVKNVVHDVLTKLDCRTRAQAVGLATRAGVI